MRKLREYVMRWRVRRLYRAIYAARSPEQRVDVLERIAIAQERGTIPPEIAQSMHLFVQSGTRIEAGRERMRTLQQSLRRHP